MGWGQATAEMPMHADSSTAVNASAVVPHTPKRIELAGPSRHSSRVDAAELKRMEVFAEEMAQKKLEEDKLKAKKAREDKAKAKKAADDAARALRVAAGEKSSDDDSGGDGDDDDSDGDGDAQGKGGDVTRRRLSMKSAPSTMTPMKGKGGRTAKGKKATKKTKTPHFSVEWSRGQVLCRTGKTGPGQTHKISFDEAGGRDKAIKLAEKWVGKQTGKETRKVR